MLSPPQESTPLLQSAVEQTKEAVLITEGEPLEEPGPRITYVNPAFTEITGYTSEEVIGRTPRILQGPKTEPWVIQRLRRRLERGLRFEGEAINYRKDGTPYVNQWSIAPVKDDDGRITHWVSVQRDITDKRRMNERLLSAQEKERHQMAQRMHDELGGLLTSLQMTVDRAKGRVKETANEELNTVCAEVESQIEEISTVVRLLTGQASPRLLEDYGLSKAVAKLVETFEETENLKIDLHNEIEPDERFPSLLEKVVYRVLREALVNVVRHADTKKAQVILNKSERQLRLHIIDDGKGFAPSSTTLDDTNTLGLTGIRERVEQLNGTFSLNTAEGEGTRITITLPLSLLSPPK
jgi:PAS domain S-box-containing protein